MIRITAPLHPPEYHVEKTQPSKRISKHIIVVADLPTKPKYEQVEGTNMIKVTAKIQRPPVVLKPVTYQPKNIYEYQLRLGFMGFSPVASKEEKTQARLQLMQIERYSQRGYNVRRTEQGFEFYKEPKIVEQPVWGEEYLKATSGFPTPAARGQLQAAYGFTTSFASVGQWVGEKLGIINPSRYYYSAFDIPFNERAKELTKKYPGILGGAAIGEATQMYLIGASTRTITTGLVTGSKKIITKIPSVFYEITGKFGVPRVVQKIAYNPKFQNFWQKLYSYSKGELKFVLEYPQVGKPVYETTKSGWKFKGRFFKGFGKRVLVPTETIPGLTERLHGVGSFHIRYTSGKYPTSEFITQYDKTIIKGIFRKEIKDFSASYRVGSNWAAMTGGGGGFDYSKSSEFLRHIATQSSFQKTLESPYIGFTRGEKITASIMKTESAVQPIIPTIQIPGGLTQFGRAGTKGLGASGVLIPTEFATTGLAYTAISFGYLPAKISVMEMDRRLTNSLLERQDQRVMQMNKQMMLQNTDLLQESIVVSRLDAMQRQMQKQMQEQAYAYELLTVPKTPTTKAPTVTPGFPKPVKVKVPFGLLDETYGWKLKKKKDMLGLDRLHRGFKWKIPTFEELFV